MGNYLLAVDLGSGIKAKAIATGGSHTCAILDNESVKCWGSNASGQLGLGDNRTRGDNSSDMGDYLLTVDLGSGIKAKAIVAGGSHTCAILDNASVKCWGSNASGQLGLGDDSTVVRGDEPNEMGNLLPFVDLGSERTAKSITTGTDYTCVLLDDASVKCWGNGIYGQLGNKKKGVSNQFNSTPEDSAIDLGDGIIVTAIAAGNFHTCAILDNSSIKCWGFNASGQLGQEDTSLIWSSSDLDNLLSVDLGTERTARAIAAGDNHTCVVLDDASIKCWGSNTAGQLGLGDNSTRGDGSGEMGDDLPVISL
jgi:alpha-tubulin suppressor-like RCC1 family protein